MAEVQNGTPKVLVDDTREREGGRGSSSEHDPPIDPYEPPEGAFLHPVPGMMGTWDDSVFE